MYACVLRTWGRHLVESRSLAKESFVGESKLDEVGTKLEVPSTKLEAQLNEPDTPLTKLDAP